MSAYEVPLSRIDAAYLESLRTNAVAEGRQLEYKEQLPGAADDEAKREFLRDVASFANSVGGDLIFGIRGARDAAGTATGTPEAIVGLPAANLDQETLRLDSLILQGVDPRIVGVRFHPISRGADAPCLLVRVPRSPLRLHMVTYKGMLRFYGRGAAGRFQMDVRQIRSGFLEVEAAQERVRRFRLDRVARVVAGETPIRLGGDGAKLIFHALPVTSLDVWPAFVNLAENKSQIPNLIAPMAGAGNDWRYNLDGFVIYNTTRKTYTQLFRDGGIEAAGGILYFDKTRGGFYGLAIEQATIPVLSRAQALWRLLGVSGPIMLGLAWSGVRDWKMLSGPYHFWDPDAPLDTDVAVIPDVLVDDENTPVDQALKPLFDIAWNAGGWAQSPFYGPDGERKEPR
jgi:hypothetical protein